MGAYLSEPITEKESIDDSNELLTVGASSMQGWRTSQEDAHNAILNFDKDTSFFAVYDGHGGAEVAVYCADKLPLYLKGLSAYKMGQMVEALKTTFMDFDRSLLEPEVVETLKIISNEKNPAEDSDGEEEDEEDLIELHQESHLPLNEVLQKYKNSPFISDALKNVKENALGSKPQSPYLRGRRAAAIAADAANKAAMDPDAHPQGSSTSAAVATGSSGAAGSSKVGASNLTKMETEEDSTVSSSSSSAGKTNNNTSNSIERSSIEAEVATKKTLHAAENGAASTQSNKNNAPDSSHVKESEQNGNVTSSEAKTGNIDVGSSFAMPLKSTNNEATVSGSTDALKAKQNGNVGSSTSQATSAERPVITSTGDDESTDDDADYDAEHFTAKDEVLNMPEVDDSDEDMYDDEEEEDEEQEDEEDDSDKDVEDYEEDVLVSERFGASMIEEPGKDSGCTAVVALLHGRDLYVANAGDSRCVVSRNGKAIEMSLDHKPEDEEESARIVKAGGRVTQDGRVNGGLNLSRALGDHSYKLNTELPPEEQMISALPEIKKLIITPEDEFMVLACDGIWNFMTSEKVVDFVRERLADESKKISQICEELFDHCLAPHTMGDGTGCDNMTAVIVRFKPKILELPTYIDPSETEDAINARNSPEADTEDPIQQQTLKRSASPTRDESSNEAENSNVTKRFKTDDMESSPATNIPTTTTTSITTPNEVAASSNSVFAMSSEAEAEAVPEDRDKVNEPLADASVSST